MNPPHLRLREAVQISAKTGKDIAAAVDVHPNTLSHYLSGQRQIPLELAGRIMEYIEMDYSLLFSTVPIRRKLTGVAHVDDILRDICRAMATAEDVAKHHFTPEYMCISSEYINHPKSLERDGTWTKVRMSKDIYAFGVSRQVEHESFGKRAAEKWECTPKIIFADIISDKCVSMMNETRWKKTDTQWSNETVYRSIDYLFLNEKIGEMDYGKPGLVKRKVWTPMPSMRNPRLV